MKKLLLSVLFALSLSFAATAQEEEVVVNENPAEIKDGKIMTLDELKAERLELVAMLKSEEFQKKLAKVDGSKVPADAGIAGLDALTEIVSKMLVQLRESRNVVPQLYASVTGQTLEGAAAGDIKKLSPDQLVAFSKMFIQMGTTLVKSSKDLIGLPGEITYNSKMVKNLMATNRLANNVQAGTR